MSEPSDGKSPRIQELEAELLRARSEIASLQGRLDEILASRAWQAIAAIRRVARKLPPWLGQSVRRRLSGQSQYGALGDNRSYHRWIRDFDTLSASDRDQIRSHIERFPITPVVSLIMPLQAGDDDGIRDTVASIQSQLYPHWELCIGCATTDLPQIEAVLRTQASDDRIRLVGVAASDDVAASTNAALQLATGDFIAVLARGGRLAEHALYMIAEAATRHPNSDVFYGDEDRLDHLGERTSPWFKPDWNPELLQGQNFLDNLTVYRRSTIADAGGISAGTGGFRSHDLALRLTASTAHPIVHVPFVLYHARIQTDAGSPSAPSKRPLPESWPTVSVIIPTRDHKDLLAVVIEGLEHNTDYPILQIIVADNDSRQPETLAYFDALRARGIEIVNCAGEFNFSDINNKAAKQSNGELILFLNNDVSMIASDWLKAMAGFFGDPTIAAAGAKLLYPDGSLQHAGVVLGLGGVAGHRYAYCPGDEPGAFDELAHAQDVSCVTGACLLIRRSVFDEVGRFDADNLAIAFNDVDLCLRLKAAGHRIVWTPQAVLVHHESKSRGSDLDECNFARFHRESHYMRQKWGAVLQNDPFFSPNLSLQYTSPHFAAPPRTCKPWMAE